MQLDIIKEKVNRVGGWFNDVDMDILYPYVNRLGSNSLLVEIGTYHGKSTLFFRLANPNIKILTVDIGSQVGTPGGVSCEIPRCIDKAILDLGNIFQVIGNSADIIRGFGWNIDFLFIDSLHTFEDTMSNLLFWGNRVVANGLIACHDYNKGFPGVMKAVDKYLEINRNFNLEVKKEIAMIKK
jgi:hypothetical protein